MATSAIDANSNVADVLDDVISEGYAAIGRYYSSNAKKRLTASEAAAISRAGLKIFTVFEDSAKPPLNYAAGAHNAGIAVQQAQQVKQPPGSAIYFALDSELGNQDLPAVREYFRGIKDTVAGKYKLGIYSDGVVCKVLLDEGTCDYAWLSASRGFPGSRTFYKSGRWALAQDPEIDQDFHGVSIDINEINGDFGGFQVSITAAVNVLRSTFERPLTYTALAPRCVPYFKRSGTKAAVRAAADAKRWTVPDLCKAYNWPTNQPGGGVIAIVELDGGWVQSDMTAFFNSIGQPMPTIRDISVAGATNKPNQHIGEQQDPDIEVALDIQIAAASYFEAVGKPAVINVYWAPGGDAAAIASAIRAATKDGCDVCSISWGKDEAEWVSWGQQVGQNFVADMEAAARAATTAGMIVFAASGDNDSTDGGPMPANVDLPSSCPHIIGCGGTTKTATTEVVWNNNPGATDGEGTGGGYSTVFPRPEWQTSAPLPPPSLGRMVPDVAANADPNTGYWIFVHGNKMPMGGTSAVAPLYAGLFAAFGNKLGLKLKFADGFVTPELWANQSCFNDIVQGSNGEYSAQRGPDPCTGLGSPIGSKLAALFGIGSTAAMPAVSAAAGWSGTVTYTYANGVLVSAPAVVTSEAVTGFAVTRAASGAFTVHHGHRYSASIALSGFEQLADNDLIARKFESYGFQNVTVTGSGATRQAQGVWSGPDTTVQLDSHLRAVTDLGPTAVELVAKAS